MKAPTGVELKAPSNKPNPCRKGSKKLVAPCETSKGWTDKNRFKIKGHSP